MTVKPLYRRVLLKASGEALMGEQHFGIDVSVVDRIADHIAAAPALGIEVGAVIGDGTIFPGVLLGQGRRRATATMGMPHCHQFAGCALLNKTGVSVGHRHAGALRESFSSASDRLMNQGKVVNCRRHRQSVLHH